MNYPSRVAALRQALRHEQLDAVVIFDPLNIKYLTGFDSISYSRMLALLVGRTGRPHLIVPRIEAVQARQTVLNVSVHDYGEWSHNSKRSLLFDESVFSITAETLGRLPARSRVAVEDYPMASRSWDLLRQRLRPWQPTPRAGVVEQLRLRKDPAEVARIREAAAVAAAGMRAAARHAIPGRTELMIQMHGDRAALRWAHAHDRSRTVTLSSNVLSGARIAAIHSRASSRQLRRGDLVYLVWMASVDGYWVELARTVPVGKPSPRQQQMYRIIQGAHQLAADLVKPGSVADQVDVVVRQHLRKAGYGAAFAHRTGHGVGLAGVELPNLGVGDLTPLAEGMVVSIEPGVCIEGFGGIGSSDTLLVTEYGRQWLTPRSLLDAAWAQ